jgi:hypothetical protein
MEGKGQWRLFEIRRLLAKRYRKTYSRSSPSKVY